MHYLAWEELAPGCIKGRKLAGRGRVFGWETVGLGIYVDLDTCHLPILLQAKCTPSWKRYSLMAVDSFSGVVCHVTGKNCSGKSSRY